jgi:hypothetical protein
MALERCVTGMAYEMRLVLQGIYERKDVEEARKLLCNWCTWLRTMQYQTWDFLELMAFLARMIKWHLKVNLASLTRALTTAFRVLLQCQPPSVKQEALGYRTVEYMANMLYFVAEKLILPWH